MSITPLKTRYAELVAFFQWWLPAYLPGKNLYLMGQSAPRPANPYVAFNPLSYVEIVGLDERRTSDAGIESLRGQRRLTCNVQGFSDSATRFDGNDNAWEMLQELRFSLAYPAVYDKLTAIVCRVLNEGVISDLSTTINTTNEPRAQWDFTLSTVINQTIDNGAIENAVGLGTVVGSNNDIDMSFSASKP